jgi:hypothetical protein
LQICPDFELDVLVALVHGFLQQAALPVTWDWSTLAPAALQTAGTATVRGQAASGTDGDKPVDALLTVIVVDRMASSHICKNAPSTTVTASYTEGSYAASNTCDGNAATRWSNLVSGGRGGDSLI